MKTSMNAKIIFFCLVVTLSLLCATVMCKAGAQDGNEQNKPTDMNAAAAAASSHNEGPMSGQQAVIALSVTLGIMTLALIIGTGILIYTCMRLPESPKIQQD